nr:hypothetical protein [Tanacetum cinerariifolium]
MASQEYWQQGNLLLPAGFDFEATLLGPLLAQQLNAEADALLLFAADGSWERVPLAHLVPATRSAPRGHFWQWAEEGRFAEWANGNTIAYREELNRILGALTQQGLPPLAPTLLLLAACADALPATTSQAPVLDGLLNDLPPAADDPDPQVLRRCLVQAVGFMLVVRALPPSLRTGEPKLHLFREAFLGQAPQVQADLAGT